MFWEHELYDLINLIAERNKPEPLFNRSIALNLVHATTDDILKGYWYNIAQGWFYYEKDRLFASRIDRITDFAVTGFEWEAKDDEGDDKKIFDWWSANINRDIALKCNILKGMDEVNKWGFKYLVMESMSTFYWDWRLVNKRKYRDFPVDGDYFLPMLFTTYSSNDVVLDKGMGVFDPEEIYVATGTKEDPSYNKFYNTVMKSGVKTVQLDRERCFALKFNAPAGRGQYPTPMVSGMFDVLEQRQLLLQMDRKDIKGMINEIMYLECGDKDNPVDEDKVDSSGTLEKPGMLSRAAALFKNKLYTMGFALPYWIKFHHYRPDTQALLDIQKYFTSTKALDESFGIFEGVDPRARMTKEQVELNIKALESKIEQYRDSIRRFWEQMGTLIYERNPGMKEIPNFVMQPVNLSSKEFIDQIIIAHKLGKVSTKTLLQLLKRDYRVEKSRKLAEKDDAELWIPDASYVQGVVGSDGTLKTVGRSPLDDGGRPKSGQEDIDD